MKIDTSTTAGKIAVMQAFADGKVIQYSVDGRPQWQDIEIEFGPPVWDWGLLDYRIKPQTVEEAAVEHHERKEASGSLACNDFIAGAKWQREQNNE